MQNYKNTSYSGPFLNGSHDYLFDTAVDKDLVDYLARYIITDERPVTTPALWQDVAIYIRYKKRDVWALDKDRLENAANAIFVYSIKYIIEHLTKSEIVKCLNAFYTQTKDPHFDPAYTVPPIRFFEQKLHAPIDSLFLTQEKLTIDKDQLKDFDKLFNYPCWIEFTDEALDEIFSQILKDKLTNEQLDYFLGAADNIKDYDKWLKVVKHILQTTKDPHVFWTAGDILAIIRRAVPEGSKSKKWFNDQLFEIFWPIVGSVWPLQHEELINKNLEDARILADSINWLHTIDDIKDRLPELGDNFEIYSSNTDDADFKALKSTLQNLLEDENSDPDRVVNLFFTLADTATSPETTKELQEFAKTKLIPFVKTTDIDTKKALNLIDKATKHAEDYQKDLVRECQNLIRLIK